MRSGRRFFSSLFFIFALAGCGAVPRIVVLQDPLSAEEHLQLGLSYEADGKWDLAISEYQAALQKGGAASVIEGYLGNVYFAKNDFSSATTAYRKSLQENPQNAPLLNNLANLYLAQKTDLEEAESLARRAIEIDPSRRAYYLDTLGAIYIEREDYDLALSVFREAETLAGPDGALIEAIRKNQARLVDLLGLRNGQNDGS